MDENEKGTIQNLVNTWLVDKNTYRLQSNLREIEKVREYIKTNGRTDPINFLYSLPLGMELHIELIKSSGIFDLLDLKNIINTYSDKPLSIDLISAIVTNTHFENLDLIISEVKLEDIYLVVKVILEKSNKNMQIYEKIWERIKKEIVELNDSKEPEKIAEVICNLAELLPREEFVSIWMELKEEILEYVKNLKNPEEFFNKVLEGFGKNIIPPILEKSEDEGRKDKLKLQAEKFLIITEKIIELIDKTKISADSADALIADLYGYGATEELREYAKQNNSQVSKIINRIDNGIKYLDNVYMAAKEFFEKTQNVERLDRIEIIKAVTYVQSNSGEMEELKLNALKEFKKITKEDKKNSLINDFYNQMWLKEVALSTTKIENFEFCFTMINKENKNQLLYEIINKEIILKDEKLEIVSNWLVNDIKESYDMNSFSYPDHQSIHILNLIKGTRYIEELCKFFVEKKEVGMVGFLLEINEADKTQILGKMLEDDGIKGIDEFILMTLPHASKYETKVAGSFIISKEQLISTSEDILIKAIKKCRNEKLLENIERYETTQKVKDEAFDRLTQINPNNRVAIRHKLFKDCISPPKLKN